MSGITVVMSVRDLEKTVKSAVLSVLKSPDVTQMLVLENGSKDDTLAKLHEISDPRLKVFHGIVDVLYPHTMSYLFEHAETPYVALCDGDDLYPEGRLASQRDFLDANLDYAAVSGCYQSMDNAGKPVAMLANEGEPREVTDILRRGERVSHFSALLIRREMLQQTGYFRDWFETAFDLDLQFRLAEIGRVWHDPTNLSYYYRIHDASLMHKQGDIRRRFFDTAANDFAIQRCDTGEDDLMRGTPPTLPEPRTGNGDSSKVRSAHDQIVDQIRGKAWASFVKGDRRAAFGGLVRSLSMKPTSFELWRDLAAMSLKFFRPKR